MGPEQTQEPVDPARDKNESDDESFRMVQKAAAARRKQMEEELDIFMLLSKDSEAWLRGMKQYPGE